MATQTATPPFVSSSAVQMPLAGAQLGSGANSAVRQDIPAPGEMGTTHGGLATNGSVGGIPGGPDGENSLLRLSPPVARLPVGLEVTVPVREFRVRNLLAMAPGEVIETRWGHGEDLPLSSGDVQLAWSEFEVVESRLAVRVTRLA